MAMMLSVDSKYLKQHKIYFKAEVILDNFIQCILMAFLIDDFFQEFVARSC